MLHDEDVDLEGRLRSLVTSSNGDPIQRETNWRTVDLGPAWRGERTEPPAVVMQRSDGRYLFPSGVNYLFGDSGDGKSWLLQLAALDAIRARRHVIWLTYEDPNELEVVKRFRLLGATFDVLDQYLHVIVGTEALTTGIAYLARLARSTSAVLLVLDSIGEALALDSIDEDRDSEFGPWARDTLRNLIDLAAADRWENDEGTPPNPALAIIPIDHSTKAKDNSFFAGLASATRRS